MFIRQKPVDLPKIRLKYFAVVHSERLFLLKRLAKTNYAEKNGREDRPGEREKEGRADEIYRLRKADAARPDTRHFSVAEPAGAGADARMKGAI